jgi:hypothetical protein
MAVFVVNKKRGSLSRIPFVPIPEQSEEIQMSAEKREERDPQAPAEPPAKKKPYHKPEFVCERVFETAALACGKIQPTQSQCKFNRKLS